VLNPDHPPDNGSCTQNRKSLFEQNAMTSHRRTTLCREGVAYLIVLAAVLAGAMLREVNLLLMLTGLMAGPILFSWRLVVVTMRGLDVRRRMPQQVGAGDLLVVHVDLINTRRRGGSWAVVAEERIDRESDHGAWQPLQPAVFFSYVAAGQSQTRTYRGRLNRRGRYRLGPLRLWTRFPFGLFRRTLVAGETGTLTVVPRLGRLTRRWVTRHHEAFEGTQRRERRHGGTQGDFYGVRPWQHGDSRRWIHWRASARHGTLLVRQFEQHRNRDVAVLVDLWQPEDPERSDLENVELAVSFAATIISDLCRKGGGNLLLATAGPQPICESGPASAAMLSAAMQRLALAEAQSRDRLPELLCCALDEIEPGTEVVLISTRPTDLGDGRRFDAVWSDSGRRAAARHLRAFNTADESLAEYFRVE
jgi:uncharacterized protein (DUF58 family)